MLWTRLWGRRACLIISRRSEGKQGDSSPLCLFTRGHFWLSPTHCCSSRRCSLASTRNLHCFGQHTLPARNSPCVPHPLPMGHSHPHHSAGVPASASTLANEAGRSVCKGPPVQTSQLTRACPLLPPWLCPCCSFLQPPPTSLLSDPLLTLTHLLGSPQNHLLQEVCPPSTGGTTYYTSHSICASSQHPGLTSTEQHPWWKCQLASV